MCLLNTPVALDQSGCKDPRKTIHNIRLDNDASIVSTATRGKSRKTLSRRRCKRLVDAAAYQHHASMTFFKVRSRELTVRIFAIMTEVTIDSAYHSDLKYQLDFRVNARQDSSLQILLPSLIPSRGWVFFVDRVTKKSKKARFLTRHERVRYPQLQRVIFYSKYVICLEHTCIDTSILVYRENTKNHVSGRS